MEYNTSLMNSSNKKSNYSYFNTEIGGENLKEKMIKYSKNIRIKSKRNSYKPPLKINNYFVDVNEEDSKYYKLTKNYLGTYRRALKREMNHKELFLIMNIKLRIILFFLIL